jgi:hypothetical protein
MFIINQNCFLLALHTQLLQLTFNWSARLFKPIIGAYLTEITILGEKIN